MECGFCGYERPEAIALLADTSRLPLPWLHHEARDWGMGPGKEEMWLCPFCANSYTVSSWLAGLSVDDRAAKDRSMFANMLLEALSAS